MPPARRTALGENSPSRLFSLDRLRCGESVPSIIPGGSSPEGVADRWPPLDWLDRGALTEDGGRGLRAIDRGVPGAKREVGEVGDPSPLSALTCSIPGDVLYVARCWPALRGLLRVVVMYGERPERLCEGHGWDEMEKKTPRSITSVDGDAIVP